MTTSNHQAASKTPRKIHPCVLALIAITLGGILYAGIYRFALSETSVMRGFPTPAILHHG